MKTECKTEYVVYNTKTKLFLNNVHAFKSKTLRGAAILPHYELTDYYKSRIGFDSDCVVLPEKQQEMWIFLENPLLKHF